MLFGVDDLNIVRRFDARLGGVGCCLVAHHVAAQAHGHVVVAHGFGRVRRGVLTQRFGCALRHNMAAADAAFRTQIYQPVRCANHVQVVLNHQHRVARLHQTAQRAHQRGNVFKVQAGGGLVKHKQRAFFGDCLTAAGAALGRLGQKACQPQALRFATRQGGHGLA